MAQTIGVQEFLLKPLIFSTTYQATATVQASPAPTTTTFTVSPANQPFRLGEAYVGGISTFIQTYNTSTGAVTVSPPLPLAPTAGVALEQDEPSPVYAPYTTNAATNGLSMEAGGFNGAQAIEIVNTGSGTCTITFEGSNGQTDVNGNIIWYAVGYQQVDGIAAPARSVAPISVTAGNVTTFAHTYQILDLYRFLRTRLSVPTAGMSIFTQFTGVPV